MKFKHAEGIGSGKRFNVKFFLIALVATLFIGWIVERYVHKGTFFGYQVRHVKTSNPFTGSNNEQKSSKVCESITSDDIKSILGVAASRMGNAFGDREKPTFISTCTYKLEDTPIRVVTMVVRDTSDEATAKKQFQTLTERKGSQKIDGLGDEATYLDSANQVSVRKGKRLYTVSISKPTKSSKKSSQDGATEIVKLLLNKLS